MMALSTLVEYIKRPFRKMPERHEQIPQHYRVEWRAYDGKQQWTLCASDGFPIMGFGTNYKFASARARALNMGAYFNRTEAERDRKAAVKAAIRRQFPREVIK